MAFNSIQYTKDQNPWYSFRPYQENDADRFKGRGKDIAEVMKSIIGNDFVVCYAKSGIGKSSLINAGLMPRLRKKQILPIQIKFTENFFAEDDFENNIRTQINSEIKKLNEFAISNELDEKYVFVKHPCIEDNQLMLSIDAALTNKSVWWWLNTYQLICFRGEFEIVYRPILIFDQFEELFQKTQSDEQREKFFTWLQEMSLSRPSDAIQKKIQVLQEFYPDTNVSLPSDCGWKILLSLREDYVGLLDYWCIQRIRIPAVQDNRFCLMPLTTEQAEEVILQQSIEGYRVELLDRYKQIIIDSLLEPDGVPAVLLSVLCNRIFDEEVSGYANTAQKLKYFTSKSGLNDNEDLKKIIRSLIRSVYEERIKESKVSKRLINKIEQVLVRDNGTRKRPELSELSKKQQNACGKLANVYLVRIDDFGERKGQKVQYVEIIHDRVAEVVADKRHDVSKKKQVFWSRIALIVGFVLIFGFTYWNQFWTSNLEKAKKFPYMEYRDIVENGIATKYKGKCENLWSLQTIKCDSSITVSNCPSLELIDALNCSVNNLDISVKDCANLKKILLGDKLKTLTLNIAGCPQLQQIEIPRNIVSLKINVISDRLSFKLEDDSHYFWNDGILWDKQGDSILYARSDAESFISVPYTTEKKHYTYYPRTFSVQNTDSVEIKFYRSARRYTKHIARNTVFIDFSEDSLLTIPSGLFKNFTNLKHVKFPSSLRYIEEEAFMNCSSLISIEFNDSSVTNIGKKAFANCNSLETIVFPQIVRVGVSGFEKCGSLKELHFGKAASIGEFAFRDCSSLSTVYLPNEIESYDLSAFRGDLKIDFIGDSAYWIKADDESVVYRKNHFVILTNNVRYHTYTDSIYDSRNGILYYKNKRFNEPVGLVTGHEIIMNNGSRIVNNADKTYRIDLPLMPSFSINNHDTIISIPQLLIYPSKLRELHLPYSNMVDISKINALLSDSSKANVTLYVPYGCLKYFVNNKAYRNFKEIKEETLYNWAITIFKHHLESGIYVVNYFNFVWMIVLIVFLSTILLSWYIYYRTRKEEGSVSKGKLSKIILKSLATVVVGPCFWYIVYWFLFLSVIPLFNINYTLFSSPWCFMPCAVVAGVVAFISVYLVMYSDGFSLNGMVAEIKENAIISKQLFINVSRNPKKAIKPLCIILLPILIYFAIYKYNEYRTERLRKATEYVNKQLSVAKDHPEDALSIYYDAWQDTHDIISGEQVERDLFNSVYKATLEAGLLDTCFSNIRADFMVAMPDNKILFSDYWKDKSCVLQEKKDTLCLLNDDYHWYSFNKEGTEMAFYNSYGVYIMNLLSYKIDTLKNAGRILAFHPGNPIIAYSNDNSNNTIRFYDIEKKQNTLKSIFLNHYINGFCYDYEGSKLITVALYDTILSHQWQNNKWITDTLTCNQHCISMRNPKFIGKDKFSVLVNDTLKIWPVSHIGEKKYEQHWNGVNDHCGNSFSLNGKYYITYIGEKLRILNLAQSSEDYLSVDFNNDIHSACFSNDGQWIYVADRYNIFRFPLMSPNQIYEKLKHLVNN